MSKTIDLTRLFDVVATGQDHVYYSPLLNILFISWFDVGESFMGHGGYSKKTGKAFKTHYYYIGEL